MIVDDALKAVKDRRSPLLLTERREHLETLDTLLESKVANVIVVKGGMGKKQRKAVSDRIRALGDGQEKEGLRCHRI